MNIGIILAGGVGSRVGAGIPKQFIKILGKPVLAYTIDAFDKHPDIDAILVVCVKAYVNYIWELKTEYDFRKINWVTEGGATFQESVMNGMYYLKNKIKKDDIVLYHFGASPFITPDIITDVIKVCKEKRTNAISTTDYLLLSGEKRSTETVLDSNNYTEKYINRDTIAVMNSPHAFQYGFLLDFYKEAVDTGIINLVEPHTTTLMYALGKRIFFSKGSQTNIKITTKEDLRLFEGYVLEQERHKSNKTIGDIIVPLAKGFEECEAILVIDIFRRAGLEVITASIDDNREVISSRNIPIITDAIISDVDFNTAKLLFLPGGRFGTENLSKCKIVKEQCAIFAEKKYLAAICAAPSLLASLKLLKGKNITCHPDYEAKMIGSNIKRQNVVVDGNIITGQGLGAAFPFAFEVLKMLGLKEKAEQIKKAICF